MKHFLLPILPLAILGCDAPTNQVSTVTNLQAQTLLIHPEAPNVPDGDLTTGIVALINPESGPNIILQHDNQQTIISAQALTIGTPGVGPHTRITHNSVTIQNQRHRLRMEALDGHALIESSHPETGATITVRVSGTEPAIEIRNPDGTQTTIHIDTAGTVRTR